MSVHENMNKWMTQLVDLRKDYLWIVAQSKKPGLTSEDVVGLHEDSKKIEDSIVHAVIVGMEPFL